MESINLETINILNSTLESFQNLHQKFSLNFIIIHCSHKKSLHRMIEGLTPTKYEESFIFHQEFLIEHWEQNVCTQIIEA